MSAAVKKKWDSRVMQLNVELDALYANIAANLARPLPQLYVHPESFEHVAIVGGGWSLDETFEELRQLYFSGVKLVAVNGSGRWLMERNLRPSIHIMLDARPENLEFIQDPIPGCRYLLASQCHPSLIEACLDRDLTLFHCCGGNPSREREMFDAHYFGKWQQVPSCGTVGVTSILLLRLLGFRFQHLFGMDSCYSPKDARHHAYPMPLNDGEGAIPFTYEDREFLCSAWMASQAQNFVDMIKENGELVELAIHGDGLLGYLLKSGGAFVPSKEEG